MQRNTSRPRSRLNLNQQITPARSESVTSNPDGRVAAPAETETVHRIRNPNPALPRKLAQSLHPELLKYRPHEATKGHAPAPSSSSHVQSKQGRETAGVSMRVPDSVQAALSERHERESQQIGRGTPTGQARAVLPTRMHQQRQVEQDTPRTQPFQQPRHQIQQQAHHRREDQPKPQNQLPSPPQQQYAPVQDKRPQDPPKARPANRPLKVEPAAQSPVLPQSMPNTPPNANLNREYNLIQSPSSSSLATTFQPYPYMHPTSNAARERAAAVNSFQPPSDRPPQTSPPQIQATQPSSPRTQRTQHVQQSYGALQLQPHGQVLGNDMFMALITRMDRIADGDNAVREHQATLDRRINTIDSVLEQRLGGIERMLEAVRDSSARAEMERQQAFNLMLAEADRRQKHGQQAEKKQKEAEKEMVDLMDGQKKILGYLHLLSQHLMEIKRATKETKQVLGVTDSTVDAAAMEVEGYDMQTLSSDLLAENGTKSDVVVKKGGRSSPSVHGWQPHEFLNYRSGQAYDGPSVLYRLQTMEKMQNDLKEWCQKVGISNTALFSGKQQIDVEVQCDRYEEKVMQQSGRFPIQTTGDSDMSPPQPRADSDKLDLSPIPAFEYPASTRSDFDNVIDGPSPISSTSVVTLIDEAPFAASVISKASEIRDENGPIGKAGAQSKQEKSTQEVAAQCDETSNIAAMARKAPEAMDVDVFESRPNLQVDVRENDVQRSQSTNQTVADGPSTLVTKDNRIPGFVSHATRSVSTGPSTWTLISPSKDMVQSRTPSRSGRSSVHGNSPPSLKIKIRLPQQRISDSATHGKPTTVSEHSNRQHSPTRSSARAASVSASPKPNSPFGLSPVKDWAHNHSSLSFDFNQAGTSTPTRPPRLLRSSSRSQTSISTHLGRKDSLPPPSPTKLSRTRSLLALSRKAKVDEVKPYEMGSGSAAEDVENIVQPRSLQKSVSLDSATLFARTPSEGSSLFIRIPSSMINSGVPQTSVEPSCSVSGAMESKGEVEQGAELAVQESSPAHPQEPHGTTLIMEPSQNDLLLRDPPIVSNLNNNAAISPVSNKLHTAPSPLEGTVAALRQKVLGSSHTFAGTGLELSRIDSREAKQEALEILEISNDKMETGTQDSVIDETDSGMTERPVSQEVPTPGGVDVSVPQSHEHVDDVHEDGDVSMDGAASESVLAELNCLETPSITTPTTLTISSQNTSIVVENSMASSTDVQVSLGESIPLPSAVAPHESLPSPRSSPQSEHEQSRTVHTSVSTCPPSPSSAATVLATTGSSNPTYALAASPSPLLDQDMRPSSSPSSPSPSEIPIESQIGHSVSQSFTSTNAVDERQVDSLLTDKDLLSSPMKVPGPESERELSEPDVTTIAVLDTQSRSPPSDTLCSLLPTEPEVHQDHDDAYAPATGDTVPNQSEGVALTRPSIDAADDMQDRESLSEKQAPQDMDQGHDIPSQSLVVRAGTLSPTPPANEKSVSPETILQIKTELESTSARRIAHKETTPPKLLPEPEYLYISDSSPEKRSVISKSRVRNRVVRSPSIILISSDGEDDQAKSKAPFTVNDADTIEISSVRTSPRSVKGNASGTAIHTPIVNETRTAELPSGATKLINANKPNRSAKATPANSVRTEDLSPLSDLPESISPSPASTTSLSRKQAKGKAVALADKEQSVENAANSSFDFKKYSAKLDADDEVPIVPLRKKRKMSRMSEVATEDGSFADSEKGPAPKKKSLLIMPKKGRSVAITRVKKRKNVLESDAEDQPPLKRAHLRRETRTPIESTVSQQDSSSKPKEKEKIRTREQPVRSPAKKAKVEVLKTPTRLSRGQQKPRAVVWPTTPEPDYDQFIKCDSCECWYHLGCVGVHPDDPCMDDAELYTCPPCVAGVSVLDSESPTKVRKGFDDRQTNSCSRPKCERLKLSKKKQVEPAEQTYVIESFLGRHRRVIGGQGTLSYYLVKWHGYPIAESTWEESTKMRLSSSSTLIQTFEVAAADEDIDLVNCPDEYILLQEAIDAGWQPDGTFKNW